MLNLKSITSEELARKVNAIPQATRTFLSSSAFVKQLPIWEEKYILLEDLDQPALFEQLIIFLAAGFMKPEELSENLEEFVYLDHERATGLADEVLAVMKPVLSAQILTPAFATAFTGQAPVVTPPTVPVSRGATSGIPEETPRKPALVIPNTVPSVPKFVPIRIPVSFKTNFIPTEKIATPRQEGLPMTPAVATSPEVSPRKDLGDVAPAPFMIHESSGSNSQRPIGNQQVGQFGAQQSFGISRPTFIRPNFTPAKNPSSPTVARVQFGEQVIGKNSAGPKIVNYAAPKTDTSVESLNLKIKNSVTGNSFKPNYKINSENVVDLKDLPQ